MIKTIRFWIDNARYTALPQSVTPALLAIAMASNGAYFSWLLALVALFGVIFAHLAMNLSDDYFDYKNGDYNRRAKASQGMRVRIAKCEYLSQGKATLNQLLLVMIVFFILSFICGGIIISFRGWNITFLVLVAGVLGLGYSFPWLRLSYRGLGELVVGAMFGPLLMVGVYFASSGVFDIPVLFVSIAVGLLVTNIVYSHSILDVECDKSIDKITFAQILGTKKYILSFSFFCCFLPFIIIFLGVYLDYLHWTFLFSFLTLPMAIYLFKSMKDFCNNSPSELEPKWFLGKMERWDKIKESGIDWFMFRWYLARNLVSFFCLILMIVSYLSSF